MALISCCRLALATAALAEGGGVPPFGARGRRLSVRAGTRRAIGDWVLRGDYPVWDDVPYSDDAAMIGEVQWAGLSLS